MRIHDRDIQAKIFPLIGQTMEHAVEQFGHMMEAVQKMVRASLDAHVNLDTTLARSVGRMDDEVDDLHRDMFRVLRGKMEEDPGTVARALAYLSASKELERVADLATNIAEDVVFLVEGEVIRHQY